MFSRRSIFQLCLVAAFASLSFAHADDKTIKLASLDWPPYTGAKLPDQGASVAVAKAAFKAMGMT